MQDGFQSKHCILMIKYILFYPHYKDLEVYDYSFAFQILL